MSSTKVDVIELIDRHPVTSFQIGVLILCMLVAALDGFDTQAIGYTAPAIAGVLKFPMSQFGQVGSIGLLGAALGALSFGPFADVFGRKWFMIVAIVVFALFSLLTAHSASFEQLLGYRFLAGLGLGGATSAFLAMGAELAPKRLRDVFVTVLFASFPAGGLIGSLTSAWVIPTFGWQAVFYIGAVAPLIVAVILAIWLPESVRFLLARNIRQDEVRRTLAHHAGSNSARRRTHHDARSGTTGNACASPVHGRSRDTNSPVVGTVLHGLHGAVDRDVLDAVGTQFRRLLAVSRGIDRRPQQFRQRVRERHVGLVGASIRRLPDADTRFHHRRLVSCLVRTGNVVGVRFEHRVPARRLLCRWTGTGLIALAAGMYPTSVRSTGIGWAMGMGRVGQFFGPFLTGLLVALGWKVGGIFYAAAVPCFIGALFLFFLLFSRPTMEPDASAKAAPAE